MEAVYPRVGGGTNSSSSQKNTHGGLSPRGRGNRPVEELLNQRLRSIPAWAGEPYTRQIRGSSLAVYPRVGGGTEGGRRQGHKDDGLSPRGRGNLEGCKLQIRLAGSIPAWAGEPQ